MTEVEGLTNEMIQRIRTKVWKKAVLHIRLSEINEAIVKEGILDNVFANLILWLEENSSIEKESSGSDDDVIIGND